MTRGRTFRIAIGLASIAVAASAVIWYLALRGRSTPAEVAARGLIERVHRGEDGAVYADAALELRQAINADQLAAYVEERRVLMGQLAKVGRARPIASPLEGASAFRFRMTYERGETTADVVVVERGGEWRLARYHVPLPAALMPGPDNPVPPPDPR